MLRFAGDPSYHQCSIFLPSLGPIRAVGGGERLLCVGSWMGCVAEVAEPRASPRHRPVRLALRRIGLWALSRPSAHIRACCRACGTSPRFRSRSAPPPANPQLLVSRSRIAGTQRINVWVLNMSVWVLNVERVHVGIERVRAGVECVRTGVEGGSIEGTRE